MKNSQNGFKLVKINLKSGEKAILSSLIILLLNYVPASGQVWEWVHKDDSIITQVKTAVLTGPKSIETYFKINGYQRSLDSLGFGWVKRELDVAGGYISIYADFYYQQDSLKTIILWSYLPDEKSINKRYRTSYIKFLPIDSGNAFYYKYRPEDILMPLQEYLLVKNHISPSFELLNYMSPSSDLYYGYRGGVAGSILPNRQFFESIKSNLTKDEVIVIMYSINPASRLTAIEYFLKNKSRFRSSDDIENWIALVFMEKPKIETMNGCIISEQPSASLVKKFAKSSLK
jgi:hypothetical protein